MSIYDTLDNEQREAVTEGPLMLAGGQILTHRIAYLIEEKESRRGKAITFNNKAAQEMRERVDALVGYGSEDIWISIEQ